MNENFPNRELASKQQEVIRIAYDIAILARLRHCGVPESGLARASRDLLKALLEDPRVSVCIVSSEAPVSALHICEESGWRKEFKVSGGIWIRLLLRIVVGLDRFVNTLSEKKFPGAQILKSLTFRAAYQLKKIPIQPISSELFKECDIYHSSFLKIPQEAIRVSNCLKVLFVHDVIALRHPEWFDAQAPLALSEIMDSLTPECFVIANSEYTKRDFSNVTGFPLKRVRVAALAADSQRFYPCKDQELKRAIREKIGLGENQPFLLSLCTIEPRKNLLQILESWVEARSRYCLSDLAIVLAGQIGWRQEGFWEFLDSVGIHRSFIYTPGFIPDEDLAALYGSATAFIYLSQYEGFGLPPLEAMQCGVPVIASCRTSIPEVVADSAILVDPQDTHAIAEKIHTICQSEQLRRELGNKGIERATLFSWSKCANDCVDAYGDFISSVSL